MKKPLIGADLILSLGFIAYLYFDIKSDGDGSFLKGLKEMTSDVVFWYIVLALIIFAPIAILYAKKLEKNKKRLLSDWRKKNRFTLSWCVIFFVIFFQK